MIKKSLIAVSVAALAVSSVALPAAAASSTDNPIQLAMKHGCNPCKAKGCNPCKAKGCNPCAAKKK